MTKSNAPGALCGRNYAIYGPAPPVPPTCDQGHRAKLMRYRVRSDSWICDRCKAVMSHADNMARPPNVIQEYRFLAGIAQDYAMDAAYDHWLRKSHSRVYRMLDTASRWQKKADDFYKLHQAVISTAPYRAVADIVDETPEEYHQRKKP